MSDKKSLSEEEKVSIITLLQDRFAAHPERHAGVRWEGIKNILEQDEQKLRALWAMEHTGGEPDVIEYDPDRNAYLFVDCAAESPAGRRSLCYDREGLESRKENRPETSAQEMAKAMGISILTETLYRKLQSTGRYDTKTSSWIETPEAIRKLGGALFMEYRYGTIFLYHNGAQSYYAVRGFRGYLWI